MKLGLIVIAMRQRGPAHREDPGPPGGRRGPAPARAHGRRGASTSPAPSAATPPASSAAPRRSPRRAAWASPPTPARTANRVRVGGGRRAGRGASGTAAPPPATQSCCAAGTRPHRWSSAASRSNYHTGAVRAGAPTPSTLLEAGVPVAICCDNTTVSRTDLVRESMLAAEQVGLPAVEAIHRAAGRYPFIRAPTP